MFTSLSFWLALSAATLSTGESSALLIGMRDAAGPTQWMTGANVTYAVTDIVLGLGLGAAVLAGKGDSWYAVAALGAIVLSCGIRALEYGAGVYQPFCANGPLFAIDVLKLVLAAGVLAVTISSR